MRLLRRLWYIATRRRRDAELAEEIALHRELKAQELRERGVGEAGLEAATRRAIGNDLLARERAHDVWVAPLLQDITRDVRMGMRMLLRERGLSAVAIVTLILVSVALASVAIAASVWPARRAAGIDPAVALRTE